jgi:IS66 Orf2 like protein
LRGDDRTTRIVRHNVRTRIAIIDKLSGARNHNLAGSWASQTQDETARTDPTRCARHLFLSRSRGGCGGEPSHDRRKALDFDRDGYAQWYRRPKEGTFQWPKLDVAEGLPSAAQMRSVDLRPSELAMLRDGIDPRSVRRTKRYRPKT